MSEPKLSPAAKVAQLNEEHQKALNALAKEVQTGFNYKLNDLKGYFGSLPAEMRLKLYDSDAAQDALKALSLKYLRLDVTPDEILAFLADGEKTMSQIVKFFDFKRAKIAKIIKELAADGKVKSDGKGKGKTYQKI